MIKEMEAALKPKLIKDAQMTIAELKKNPKYAQYTPPPQAEEKGDKK